MIQRLIADNDRLRVELRETYAKLAKAQAAKEEMAVQQVKDFMEVRHAQDKQGTSILTGLGALTDHLDNAHAQGDSILTYLSEVKGMLEKQGGSE